MFMQTPSSEPSAGASDTQRSAELEIAFDRLQHETLDMVLAGVFIGGLILLGITPQLSDPMWSISTGLGLFLLSGIALALRRRYLEVTGGLLVGGCIMSIVATIAWGHIPEAIYLLALPVGLMSMLFGTRPGAALATLCTAGLLIAPRNDLPFTLGSELITLVMIWGILGVLWLAMRPLLAATKWAWSGYSLNQSLLAESRDTQVRLQQTLEDLTAANQQLTRLIGLTDGLRMAAEEAHHAKQQFVANVSHELRTPLNMIIGFTQLIVNTPQTYGTRLPPALMADLNVILRNSEHLLSLVDDVLDLSQIEAGQMAITKERVDPHEVISAAVTAVLPLYETKGLYLRTNLPAELPSLLCDRTRIREVLLNLLSNAGRFTDRGGVEVHVEAREREIEFSVTDTGPGIAASDADRIFRPFEQLDSSIRRRYGGSGLGLNISKSLVELHGGKMWLESRVGAGTTFHFTLPLELPSPTPASAMRWIYPDWDLRERTHPPRAPVGNPQPRFVVVDASGALTKLLTRYMNHVELACVANLEEAARDVMATPAHAVLVNTATMSEALHGLRAAADMPFGTPVVMCSIQGMPEAADALGASEYLMKPFAPADLLAALDRAKLQTGTILVVDDEPDAVRLFWRVLNSSGRSYRVLTARTGRQALELMHEFRPNAVLLDLVMPEMDGFAFLAAKNEDPALHDIPVIVISAQDPSRKPIVSDILSVTRSGGMSVHHLIACLGAISTILTPVRQPLTNGSTGSP
jgi:signal transduction histidine kinase/CheY-like chemotaxis protein